MKTAPEAALAYIGLGSNLDNPLQQVASALSELGQMPHTTLLQASSWYRSAPLGPGPQPDYINGVALLQTTLEPHELLRAVQQIEDLHGRERSLRWGARTLDLDILLYDDQVVSSPELQIPHPQLPVRNFVLYPLAELCPDLILPDHKPLAELLANVSSAGIVRLADA